MSVSPAAMRRLMREISDLKKSPPEGIRIQTSDDDMLDVLGIIQGPEGTPYAGGYFNVRFVFTEEFPAAPPKCRFTTKIFHPNVSAQGEICVNTLKKDWKSTYGIAHILVTVKCLLIYPNPESALDEEAGKLLLENYQSYCDRAKLITSVHATPRTRPAEFDEPKESSTSDEVPSAPSSKPPSVSVPPVPTLSVARKPSTPSPTTQPRPLGSAPSNVSTGKEGLSVANKERHTSPSPLGTADANVAAKSAVVPPSPAAKAVKRAATATAGAEKRKKALRRL